MSFKFMKSSVKTALMGALALNFFGCAEIAKQVGVDKNLVETAGAWGLRGSEALNKAADSRKSNSDLVENNLLNEPSVRDYVDSVAKPLLKLAEASEGDVLVMDSPVVQGQSDSAVRNIYVTRGMLNFIRNEAELACLISHEIGHLVMNQKLDRDDSILSGILDLGTDSSGIKGGVRQEADDYKVANFSQQVEEEADWYGAKLAAKAGYDPYAFVALFNRLSNKVDKDFLYHFGKLKGTHKTLEARAAILKRKLAENGYQVGAGKVKAGDYQGSLTALAKFGISSGTAKSELSEGDRKNLSVIESDLKKVSDAGQKLSPVEFMAFMRRLQPFARKTGISRDWLTKKINHAGVLGSNSFALLPIPKFMDEKIEQDRPSWLTANGDLSEDGRHVLRVLGMVAKLGLGIAAPEAFIALSAYEAISGKDFITDEKLSQSERVLVAVGALLPGAGASFESMAEKSTVSSLALSESEAIAYQRALGDAKGALEAGENWVAKTADEINEALASRYSNPPFKPGELVWQGEIREAKDMYRVGSGAQGGGDWLTDFDPSHFSAKELKEMLALPSEPTSVFKVKVPAGTPVSLGIANKLSYGEGGAVQWFLNKSWNSMGLVFEKITSLK